MKSIGSMGRNDMLLLTLLLITIKNTKAQEVPKGDPKAKDSVTTTLQKIEVGDNELSEIVLSVSKWQQDKRKAPQKTLQLSQQDVLFSSAQTTADFLEQSGNVSVQKSQLGGGSPMIRGFAANRLLISVDGVRMNNAIFRSGNLQNVIAIDPFSIERAEVIFGPGSVAYGSDAIGGVLSFYTKKATTKSIQGNNMNTSLITRYTTANQEKTISGSFGLKQEKWGSLTTFTLSDFENQRMGSFGPKEFLRPEFVISDSENDQVVPNSNQKVQRQTEYNQYNLLQKFTYKPSKYWTLDAGLLYSQTSDVPRYDRLIQYRNEQLRFAEWKYGPQVWSMTNMAVTHTKENSFYNSMRTVVAYQLFKESRVNRRFGEVTQFTNEEKVDAYSINTDFQKMGVNKGTLYYGMEGVFNRVGSIGVKRDIGTGIQGTAVSRYPDGSQWLTAALYGSYLKELSPTLSLQLGGRYNYVKLKGNVRNAVSNTTFDQIELESNAITYSAGFNWSPNRKIAWRLNYGTAFRAPNLDDVAKVFDPEPGIVIVPNSKVKPERARNIELGLILKPSQTFKLGLTTYHSILRGALIRSDFTLNNQERILFNDELSDVQALQNATKTTVYGLEADLEFKISKSLKLTSQYNLVKGRDKAKDRTTTPTRHVTPAFGNAHVFFNMSRLALDAFVMYSDSLSFDQLAPSEQNKPFLYATDSDGNPFAASWYTINLRSSYHFSSKVQAMVLFENLTDQRYRTYASGVAAAGRSISLSLKLNL